MISIQPADETSTTPAPALTGAPPQPEETLNSASPEAGKKRVPMVWIPAILGVGLLIAASYLGARIITAHRHALTVAKAPALLVPSPPAQIKPAEPKTAPQPAAPVIVPQPAVSSPAALVNSAPPPPEKPVQTAEIPTIVPKAGERYIQVGALDQELTRRYLPQLRQEKLEPHVAAGPTPQLLRILIGPFPDRDSLNNTKTELDKAGIENFVRQY
ncbi:MAG TPA: SPOR domain-containing protein [Bryobacteraceae bacterium]|nr:SPOR domain-containing protein [Bryobacteraceae bacterium]